MSSASARSLWGPEKIDMSAKQGARVENDDDASTRDEREEKSKSWSATSFYRVQPVFDRRVHVMGTGNVGRFIAHALRGIPSPPPVTMILHSWMKMKEWEASPKRLQLITDGEIERREGYDVELAFPRLRYHGKEIGSQTEHFEEGTGGKEREAQPEIPKVLEGESTEPIHSLILCTKATQVLQALSAVKHRLHPESVICFMQNGMGIQEEVNREIFPDPETRPHYMVGIISHGLRSGPDEFTTVHAGFGTIALCILPHERIRPPAPYLPTPKYRPHDRDGPQGIKPSSPANPDPSTPEPTSASVPWTPFQRYLLRTLLRAPVLAATAYSPPDLLQMQLEKLAINCIINPLTVMLDARNGAVLYNYPLTRVQRLLLSEISLVIRSLPELQYIPGIEHRFDPGRLETLVVGVAHRTRDNISSMLADARAGRHTEVEYINGWVVKKGEELGMRCVMNYMMVQLVKGKVNMIKEEIGEGTPFVEPRAGEEEVIVKEGWGEAEVDMKDDATVKEDSKP